MPDSNNPPGNQQVERNFEHGQSVVLWTVWYTYGAFYFCRTNISAAVPGLTDSVESGGLGLTATQVGFILAATKIAYAVGQLLNGQLSERFSPRKMLAAGMFATAAFNVAFGFGTAVYFLIFIWACNGYSQSLGWTPCVRVVVNWFPVQMRGKVIGIVGTGYQVTAVASYLVSGFAAEYLGWRGALWVPAGIMTVSALFMLLMLEERPAAGRTGDAGESTPDSSSSKADSKLSPSFASNLWLTLTNRSLWLLGISLGLLNASRYGFLDWGLTHLKEVQESGVGKAALKYAVLPVGAVAGSYLAGWATDRFFQSRRAPVTCVLLIMLGLLTLAYDAMARTSVPGTMFLLVLIGFCIYGPQVLLVGTAPADLARKGTSAAAAGFVNCMGYIGAATGDYFTGRSLDAGGIESGWQTTIYLWAGWAFAAAVAAGMLWNATAPDDNDATKV